MQSFEEQRDFYEQQWPELRQILEEQGPVALADNIRAREPLEARVLFLFLRQGVVFEEWRGKSTDAYLELTRLAVDHVLEQAGQAPEEETRKARTNLANVISYNLSADLADAWPDSPLTREPRHFEAGLAAAERCLQWRLELGRGPWAESMAYWAAGMHHLSLGAVDAARDRWQHALRTAQEAATADGKETSVSRDGTFGVLLSSGYLGIAEQLQGDASGARRYDEAIAAFRGQLDAGGEAASDAQFGLDQLEFVRGRYGAE